MADSDEIPTITDSEDAAWVAAQRALVEIYLQRQGCEHAGVSLEPRWFYSPFLAVWAVRSKANPDVIGWWAISGDVPTDYITATREMRSMPDVLTAFAAQWTRAADAMSRGEYSGIGKPGDEIELVPLLRVRAETLLQFAENEQFD